jgi:hypothetical protein
MDSRRSEGQGAVKHAFVPSQRVQKLLDAPGEPLDEHDFDAQIVAEVDVCGREDQVVVVVLRVGEFLAEARQVVIVDEGYRAHRLLVLLPFNLNETVADHVADELGPVRVPTLLLESVELLQERLFKGETEPNKVGHGADCTPRFGDSVQGAVAPSGIATVPFLFL